MNEKYKKLTDDFKNEFAAKLASPAFAEFFVKAKDASVDDSGTFDVVVSTADRDRQNEIVMQDGWDLSFYKLNPVVLWAHDYSTLPIGVCTSIAVIEGKLVAQGKFAPASANPFAQQVRMLYELGMVKTTSVGFIPTEFDANDRDVVTKAQLLEFSFVPVPANPYALSLRQVQEKKLDVAFLMTKGLTFNIKEKEAQSGDSCQLDDGTPGILGKDPKNPDGPMVCIPAKSMGYKDALSNLNKAIETFKADHTKAHKDHQENHMKAIEVFKTAIMDCMKDVDIAKAFSEKGVEVFKGAFDNHMKAVGLENERHSKEMDEHCMKVGKAIEVFKESVKDYVDGGSTGDDTGGNPTADSVRMMHAVKDAFTHMTSACAALKAFAEAEGGEGNGKSTDDADGSSAAAGSKSSDKDVADAKKFADGRELLRQINSVIGKTLRDFNVKERSAGNKK